MTHLHITTWVIAIILFIVAISLINKNEKAAKIVQMILRVFYILVIATGIILFFQVDASGTYHVKMLAGILVIALMELVLMQTKKRKPATIFWVLFFIILVFTIYLGLTLPLGFWIK